MALTARAKTVWLLLVGAAIIAFLLIPLRFSPVVTMSIEALSIQAREQLIRAYEQPGKDAARDADSLRAQITRRYGGTTPTQDSVLGELEADAKRMSEVCFYLRNPKKVPFADKELDVGAELRRLLDESNRTARQAREAYLK